MLSKVFVVALAALVAQSAMGAECERPYTVKEGDICDSISAANCVSTYQLAVNNIQKINAQCTNLVPGEELCLGYAGEDCKTTYVVKPDDTCEEVASQAGTTTTILKMNNPQIDDECSNIYIGEVLCTAKTVQVPSAPAGSPKPSSPPDAQPASHPKDDGDDDDDDLPYCDEL